MTMASKEVSNKLAILPPPPPPPPPLSSMTVNTNLHQKNPKSCYSVSNSDEDLQNAKTKIWQEHNIEEPPVISFYRHIDPILQEGPICGLVALSMASSCTKEPISIENLFEKAKLCGFTSQGEMFSVDNMATLAQECLKDCNVEILHTGLSEDKERIIEMITKGSLLLLPYDADKNHSPSNLRGHKAHWAVILGVLRSTKTCHLIARHGKSRHLGVWLYEMLQSSNENLIELDPENEGKLFILPSGGVEMGLCGRAVFLHIQSS